MEVDENGTIKVDIEKLNILDPQSGVYNSDFFFLRLNEEIKRATRYDLFFSFVLIMINDKKELFENIDEITIASLLEEMGYCIKDAIRGDIDLAGHIDPGSFALILPETDIHGAFILAKRIKTQLDKGLTRIISEESDTIDKDLSVNIGIIEVPEDAKSSSYVIKKARRAMKSNKEETENIGLSKALEKYPSRKKKVQETEEKPQEQKEENKKSSDYYLPFLEILSKGDTPEVENPKETDVRILKELEKRKILYTIDFDNELYQRKSTNAFGSVKLLNQKRFIYIEDPELKTAIPCITPHSTSEIRDKILKDNIYCAGSIIYSYDELRFFNEINKLTSYSSNYNVSQEDKKILTILNAFKGSLAVDGKWIVDPNSPFDTLYMMVRRRFLFKVDNAPAIYYHDLIKDKDSQALYPIFPNCRLTPFEALRLLKRNLSIEIISKGGFHHIIHNVGELELLYQVETE